MTRNADNRTNEQTATNHLRTLLDERGVEYTESQDRFRTRFRFNYCEACSDYLNEIEVMGACITASKSYLTPEQAIAATLGSDASAVRLAERLHGIADEMRSVGASAMTPHELLACYAREVDKVADSLVFATTVGNGTLTAEQVREEGGAMSALRTRWAQLREQLSKATIDALNKLAERLSRLSDD